MCKKMIACFRLLSTPNFNLPLKGITSISSINGTKLNNGEFFSIELPLLNDSNSSLKIVSIHFVSNNFQLLTILKLLVCRKH